MPPGVCLYKYRKFAGRELIIVSAGPRHGLTLNDSLSHIFWIFLSFEQSTTATDECLSKAEKKADVCQACQQIQSIVCYPLIAITAKSHTTHNNNHAFGRAGLSVHLFTKAPFFLGLTFEVGERGSYTSYKFNALSFKKGIYRENVSTNL
jgi:hypothetical protein